MEGTRFGEKLITCPYNNAHRLVLSRFQTHLVKCREANPNVKIAICAYNNTHIVPEPELKIHLEMCKDRYLLDRHIYVPENVNRDKYPVKNIQVGSAGNDECWDDEDVPTYNPIEYCNNNKILQKLDVAPKSERRNFRLDQRAKFQNFNEKDQKQNSSRSNAMLFEPRRPVEQSAAKNLARVEPERKVNDTEIPSTSNQRENFAEGVVKEEKFIVVGKGRGRGRRFCNK